MFFVLLTLNVIMWIVSVVFWTKGLLPLAIGTTGVSLTLSFLTFSYYIKKRRRRKKIDADCSPLSLDCCDTNPFDGFDCIDLECGKFECFECGCDGVECGGLNCN